MNQKLDKYLNKFQQERLQAKIIQAIASTFLPCESVSTPDEPLTTIVIKRTEIDTHINEEDFLSGSYKIEFEYKVIK